MIVGCLGAGQLGRMLALAGIPLGLRFHFYDTKADSPAAQLGEMTVGDFSDVEAVKKFGRSVDCLTWEFENVPLDTINSASNEVKKVFPSALSLKVSQDRLVEKEFLQSHGIPVAPFSTLGTREQNEYSAKSVGFPAIVKTRSFGYDGKGQRRVRNQAELEQAIADFAPTPCIVEGIVSFQREVSIIGARSKDEFKAYPLTENVHHDGILRWSRPLVDADPSLLQQASTFVEKLMVGLDYIGVLALELFVVDGNLVANEFAPRVHNSGHWTIEGSVSSQFENHLRAGIGLPLGDTVTARPVIMQNLIGSVPSLNELYRSSDLVPYVHLYDKAGRPGRKIGHMTYEAPSFAERDMWWQENVSVDSAAEA